MERREVFILLYRDDDECAILLDRGLYFSGEIPVGKYVV